MAPKEPFKVHSLNKHILDTTRGQTNGVQFDKKRHGKLTSSPAVKTESDLTDSKTFGKTIKKDWTDSEDDSDASSDSSEDPDGLFSTKPAPKARTYYEVAESDTERIAPNGAAGKPIKIESSKRGSVKSEAGSANLSQIPVKHKSPLGNGLTGINGIHAVSKPAPDANIDADSDAGSGSGAGSDSDSGSSSDSDSETSSESSSTSGGAKVVNGTKSKPTRKVRQSSVESTSDSGSDAESSSQDSSDSDDEDTSSDGESESEAETNAKPKPKPTPKAKPSPAVKDKKKVEAKKSTDSDSSDATSSSGESESESESELDKPDEDLADVSMHMVDRRDNTAPAPTDFVSRDFVLRKATVSGKGDDLSQLYNQATVQGKQLWYFTTPPNVPITVVQDMEIPMDDGQRQRLMPHRGNDYGISLDEVAPKSTFQILIPTTGDENYQSAPRQVQQVMHIKRVTHLTDLSADAGVVPTTEREVRQQPSGLKPRHQSLAGTTISGESSNAAKLPTPVAEPAPKSATKRKQKADDVAADKEVSEPAKKKKKKQRQFSSSDEDAAAAAEQLMSESITADAKSQHETSYRLASPDLGSDAFVANNRQTAVPLPTLPGVSQAPSSIIPSTDTTSKSKEERKAEKRKKKEKKLEVSSSQTVIPSSYQPPTSSQIAMAAKETPVPLPKFRNAN